MKPGIPAQRIARDVQEDSEPWSSTMPVIGVDPQLARDVHEPTPIYDALVSAYEIESLGQYLRLVYGLIRG